MERRDSVGVPYLDTALVRRGGGGRPQARWRRTGGDAAGRGEEPSRGWAYEGEGLGFERSAAREVVMDLRRKSWAGAQYERSMGRLLIFNSTGYAVLGPWVKWVVVSWAFFSSSSVFFSCVVPRDE